MSDLLLVQTARALALWLHRDQEDKQGRPYVEHLDRVAREVKLAGGTDEQVAAAWLHDSVEDGHVGMGTLSAIFDRTLVPRYIYVLTRDMDTESYAAYIDRLIRSGSAVLLVKRADLLDHMDLSRGPIPGELMERYERALQKIEAALQAGKP